MALIHRATLRPTKLELLAAWLPGRDWYTGPEGAVERVGSFRFDDPAGAVGIETMLVRVGDGPVHQVPLTYRDAPLADGQDWLLGTAEHSALGKRWIYDAVGDPAYAEGLAGAILGNTGQAEQFVQLDDGLERREFDMTIASDVPRAVEVPVVGRVQRVHEGDPTLITTDTVELAVVRCLEAGVELAGAVLTGTWTGQTVPLPLASAALPS